MSQKRRFLFTGITVGCVLGLLIAGLLFWMGWGDYDFSMTSIKQTMDANLTMSEAELDRVSSMALQGAILHSTITRILPMICLGGVIGAIVGALWHRKQSAD